MLFKCRNTAFAVSVAIGVADTDAGGTFSVQAGDSDSAQGGSIDLKAGVGTSGGNILFTAGESSQQTGGRLF